MLQYTMASYRLFEFNVYNKIDDANDNDNVGNGGSTFTIQMFGINELGKRASIIVEDYPPFFYVKVGQDWGQKAKIMFENHLRDKIGKSYRDDIIQCKLIEKKKLYGFDNGALHRFIEIKFRNTTAYNKIKNLWYKDVLKYDGEKDHVLIEYPFTYNGTKCNTELYEANIPPLLRFFHIREISPSGWILLPDKKTMEIKVDKTTTCDHEYSISYKNIVALNDKETSVPYKIMSFDIEASSSHGDFPVPIKSYKKLATNIVDVSRKTVVNEQLLTNMIHTAFGLSQTVVDGIDVVYPKYPVTNVDINKKISSWLKSSIIDDNDDDADDFIESFFKPINYNNDNDDNDNDNDNDNDDNSDTDSDIDNDIEEEVIEEVKRVYKKTKRQSITKTKTLVDMLNSEEDREIKIKELMVTLKRNFPPLEGDKVTFIGSTFITYGDDQPYLNHCIALNTCDPVTGAEIETYSSEKDVLLAWTRLIQRENPDIVIGYNIFNFDYEFMFRRAQELGCVEEFLKLSRNNDELCGTVGKTGLIDIDRASTTVASGTYELSIIKMNGRLQVDMLNWFRKNYNLTSYKLDYVGSEFIGDDIKKIEHNAETNITRAYTSNLMGLQEGNFIHFEEIDHSSNYYKQGKKFMVTCINKEDKWFEINGIETPSAKKIKWGLAKDDVTPKDIFRMTNEGPSQRSIIAKYCIQDCNLVQHLFKKIDVITSLVEMSKLCSVPMSFLIFRGQGIKLTSYVAKKCREKGVLMPVINKGDKDDGYEGAIVLIPKCGLYLDTSQAVGDFASLYPSSMLSENLCPSSKVWTKTYDLNGVLISETGVKENGIYIYDNLPNVEYVDITFNTYRWVKPEKKGTTIEKRMQKVISGRKVCRYKQPSIIDGKEEKAIMPSILQELLKARKDTRKLIEKTEDVFMQNVLDKRQSAYKVTANSLYGQLGAKTSTFYEPDIAASTTATGRLLLTFAKRVIEECYGDATVMTSYGNVKTNAEYIYGDTDSVFFRLNLSEMDGTKIMGEKELELSIEIAQEACHNVSKVLKQPHDFEYEKTFKPFCLLSKKRYVSIKYTKDFKKGKRDEMGIVLKRRDNAPIVKDVYGGVIDILMKEQNIQSAIKYVHMCLQKLVDGNVPIDKLIITKSLRSFYKKPESIAHKVLADRIAQRDPGNKPTSGDRIAYAYFVNNEKPTNKKKLLQGDKIETPTFIKENNLKIDYSFYITNQIMKPLLQLFGLVLNDIWLSQTPPKKGKIATFKKSILQLRETEDDDIKYEKKVNKLKDKEVKELIFDSYLRTTNNAKLGNQPLTNFFKKKV